MNGSPPSLPPSPTLSPSPLFLFSPLQPSCYDRPGGRQQGSSSNNYLQSSSSSSSFLLFPVASRTLSVRHCSRQDGHANRPSSFLSLSLSLYSLLINEALMGRIVHRRRRPNFGVQGEEEEEERINFNRRLVVVVTSTT